MKGTSNTYTVNGLSHHDVAGHLGVWFNSCIGKLLTLRIEKAEDNAIGVESVAVYDVDQHIGYIADFQKAEVMNLIRRSGRKTLRAHILGLDEGLGESRHWSQAKVFIEVPEITLRKDADSQTGSTERENPWDKWRFHGRRIPLSHEEKQLEVVRETVQDMITFNEASSDDVKEHVEALCHLCIYDLSKEMRSEIFALYKWLEQSTDPEMRRMKDLVMKTLSNLGSEEHSRERIRVLIQEKAESARCEELVRCTDFNIGQAMKDVAEMPYHIGYDHEPNESDDKTFIQKLYYEFCTREQLQDIYSCTAQYIQYTRSVARVLKSNPSEPRSILLTTLVQITKDSDNRTFAKEFELVIRKSLGADITPEEDLLLKSIGKFFEEKEFRTKNAAVREGAGEIADAIRNNPAGPHVYLPGARHDDYSNHMNFINDK